MLKKGRKKGVTLIELIVALALFILLAIPVTNAIMQNIKTNKAAEIEKEKVMAISYGYENLRKLVDTLSIENEKGEHYLIDEGGNHLEYKGKFKSYIFKYELPAVEKGSYFTEKGTTSPIENNKENTEALNYEFESEIIMATLRIYEKESENMEKAENYLFRSRAIINKP